MNYERARLRMTVMSGPGTKVQRWECAMRSAELAKQQIQLRCDKNRFEIARQENTLQTADNKPEDVDPLIIAKIRCRLELAKAKLACNLKMLDTASEPIAYIQQELEKARQAEALKDDETVPATSDSIVGDLVCH